MIITTFKTYFTFTILVFCSMISSAQGLMDIGEKPASDSLLVTSKRSKNAISFSAGSTLMNNDFGNPEFENFLMFGAKRYVCSQLAISGNVKKFDVENYDFDENGFLSGDLNIEWVILPNNMFTPIIYAGPGLLVSNDFEDKNYKVQGGIGIDFVVNQTISIISSLEVNYVYDEQNGSQLLQNMNSLYYNATIGIQFYFGNTFSSKNKLRKRKSSKSQPTVIQSNTIYKK